MAPNVISDKPSQVFTSWSKQVRVPESKAVDLSGRIIEVVVGREPVTFCVHEKVICASSEYFATALNGDWKEAKEHVFQLEEEESDIFQLYLHWLYRRTIPTRIDQPAQAGNAEYLRLAKAYTLGDRLQDGSFQDVIIDAIVDKCRTEATDGSLWFPVGPVIEHIYQHTVDSSKARRLLVDLYMSHGSSDWLRDWIEPSAIPKDFLLDLATGFLDKRKVDVTANATTCVYHQHGQHPALCYRGTLYDQEKSK